MTTSNNSTWMSNDTSLIDWPTWSIILNWKLAIPSINCIMVVWKRSFHVSDMNGCANCLDLPWTSRQISNQFTIISQSRLQCRLCPESSTQNIHTNRKVLSDSPLLHPPEAYGWVEVLWVLKRIKKSTSRSESRAQRIYDIPNSKRELLLGGKIFHLKDKRNAP
jgi:hypothetical protein